MSPNSQSAQNGNAKNTPNQKSGLNNFFCTFATQTARWSGSSITFCMAVGVILVWAVTGPLFKFSDTWQLVINTGTTIVTFLMVFLIQNTQNRDSEALHLKIDELIRATKGAQNALIDLEDLTQEELDAFKEKFTQLAQNGRGSNASTQEIIEQALEESVDPETLDEAHQEREASRQQKQQPVSSASGNK